MPQLQRPELERACEDFSNIVASHPYYTVYKGTLSSGVEIAVVSTTIKSSKDWSKHCEDCFRKKVVIICVLDPQLILLQNCISMKKFAFFFPCEQADRVALTNKS